MLLYISKDTLLYINRRKGVNKMNALVSARNVTKIYNKNKLPGLNKVSFDIKAGEFVGIMGASGSGKRLY